MAAIYASNANLTINDISKANNFIGNRAIYDGSAIFLEYSNFSILNVYFNGNNNTDKNGTGALYFYISVGNITGVSFHNNNRGSIAFAGFSPNQLNSTVKNACFYAADYIKGYDIFVDGTNAVNTTEGYFCSNRGMHTSLRNTSTAIINVDIYIATFGGACTVCKMSLSSSGENADLGEIDQNKKKSIIESLAIIFIVLGTFIVITIISIIIYLVRKNRNEESSYEYYSEESTKTTSKFISATIPKENEEIPTVSLKNPLCTVSIDNTSDSLFDDLEISDDVGEV
jgi:hypothetical protein